MSTDKAFFSWTYDPTINRERADLLLHVLHFIRDGVCGTHGAPTTPPFFYQLENQVKAAIFELTLTPLTKPLPKRAYVDAGSTVDLFVAAFKREHSWALRNGPVGAFHLETDTLTNEVASRIGAFWHPDTDEGGGLPVAFDATYSNLARVNSRLALLYSLPRLLGVRLQLEGFDATREVLLDHLATMQRNLLLFGSLLGGERAVRAVKTVAPSTCYSTPDAHISFALMHHLQRDGVSPGHWKTAHEDRLRDDIRRAYEAL
jgi:hypothetical protein